MKHYETDHTATLSTRGFYTILTVCALIVAASAWVLWSNATAPETVTPPAELPIASPVAPLPDLSADTPVVGEQPEPDAPADEVAAADEADTPAPVVTVSAPVYVRPVSGAVITPFSGEELLFQPTLGDWRAHSGTDIAAEAGESVLALTDGTVQTVFEDGLYGTCVTLAHEADLTSTYRGLSEVRVAEGQAVSAGEALGVVASQIDAEAALAPHLHVETARAGTPIDVLELLGEYEVE